MPISSIAGSRFKKMVMQATGTKGYLSSSVQKTVRQIGGDKYLKNNTKVSRVQATKVMKALKDAGLAHKASSTATKFVKQGFAKEEQRQEMIKRQNIQGRAQEIAAEKAAAEQAKTGGNQAKSGSNQSVGMQFGNVVQPAGDHQDSFIGSNYGSTNLKPLSELPKPIEKPKEWIEEENSLIDMPID